MTEKDLEIQELRAENKRLKKREEAMQVVAVSQDSLFGYFKCPECNSLIGVSVNYCKYCGQRVRY